QIVRNAGLEWLWRIKEEPHLCGRYWRDGCTLIYLLTTRMLPLACRAHLRRWRRPQQLCVALRPNPDSLILQVSGDAIAQYISHAIAQFLQALSISKPLVILDFTGVNDIDQRFLGLIIMLKKRLHRRGTALLCTGVSDDVRRLFRLNELEFLL